MMDKALPYAVAAAVMLISIVAEGAPSNTYTAGDAANGIAVSRHNLGATGLYTTTPNTEEICVFCHTPHHGSAAARPLWNRAVSGLGFTAYGATVSLTNVPLPGGTTLACLSCHDGITTLDTIINAPGKGGVSFAGAPQRWDFYTRNDPFLRQGVATYLGVSPNAGFDPRINIGTDLSNDHPVSVLYNSTVASLRPDTTFLTSIDLAAGLQPTATAFDSENLRRNLWDIKGFIKSDAVIGDLLRNGRVECASCHDPHFANSTGASVDQGVLDSNVSLSGLFLRRVGGNVGSGICRTCHDK